MNEMAYIFWGNPGAASVINTPLEKVVKITILNTFARGLDIIQMGTLCPCTLTIVCSGFGIRTRPTFGGWHPVR